MGAKTSTKGKTKVAAESTQYADAIVIRLTFDSVTSS